jgi:hypothetical protein
MDFDVNVRERILGLADSHGERSGGSTLGNNNCGWRPEARKRLGLYARPAW